MAATICLFGGALLRSLYAKRTPAGGGGGGKSGKVTYITGSALAGLGGGGGGGDNAPWYESENYRIEPSTGQYINPPGKTVYRNFDMWEWNPGVFDLEDLKTGRPHDTTNHWQTNPAGDRLLWKLTTPLRNLNSWS